MAAQRTEIHKLSLSVSFKEGYVAKKEGRKARFKHQETFIEAHRRKAYGEPCDKAALTQAMIRLFEAKEGDYNE